MKARADLKFVKLRPKDGAYNVGSSHRVPASAGGVWLGPRSVFHHRVLPVDHCSALSSFFCLLLFPLLMTRLPTIGNLWQELPHSFNILLAPGPDLGIPNSDRLGCGHLFDSNVAC